MKSILVIGLVCHMRNNGEVYNISDRDSVGWKIDDNFERGIIKN
jgi:hypothetical protein